MKNKIFFLTITAIFTLTICVTQTNTLKAQKHVTIDVAGNSQPNNNKAARLKSMSIADFLYNKMGDCYQSTHCGPGNNYCNYPDCAQIIQKCHQISVDTFNQLVAGALGNSNPFDSSDVRSVVTAADCQSQKIEFYSTGNSPREIFGIVNVDNSDTEKTYAFFAYYSVVLLKTLLNQGMTSMMVYRGIQTTSGKNVIVFQVSFNGSSQYYDISDTQP